MMNTRSLASLFGLLLLFSLSAFGQEPRSALSVGATLNLTPDNKDLTIPHQATTSGGFLAGYRFRLKRWMAVEGNYGYTRNTQVFLNPAIGTSRVQAHQHELSGSAAFLFHP